MNPPFEHNQHHRVYAILCEHSVYLHCPSSMTITIYYNTLSLCNNSYLHHTPIRDDHGTIFSVLYRPDVLSYTTGRPAGQISTIVSLIYYCV